MRTIKFRAWDKLNKEMTEFGLFERPTATWGKHCEIMQFTGLLDKNGKEVYEGDIVKESKNGSLWHIGSADLWDDVYWYKQYLQQGQSFEIIGNIYENPELLK